MTAAFDSTQVRWQRLQRHWSQEHLAAASGVSVRTIQRLECGKPVSVDTLSAIAATFAPLAPPAHALALVRRATPLTILPEIGFALQAHLDLGFSRVATDHPGCVGLKAGHTYIILVTADFMADDFGAPLIVPLVGKTIPYIYVRSVDLATAQLPMSAAIVAQVLTRGHTREVLVEHAGCYQILAEKLGLTAA
jgi:DNA-binding XRE family transcriptional regulator